MRRKTGINTHTKTKGMYTFLYVGLCFIKLSENDDTPCGSNPCGNDGECRREGDGYVCTCRYGWTGVNCETGMTRNMNFENNIL